MVMAYLLGICLAGLVVPTLMRIETMKKHECIARPEMATKQLRTKESSNSYIRCRILESNTGLLIPEDSHCFFTGTLKNIFRSLSLAP